MQATLTDSSTLTKDQLLKLYREMVNIRRTEEQLARSYQSGNIPGACHTYVGQEAVAVGVCAHLTHDDVVFSTHRGHGHALAKGVPPREVIAELFGRVTGCSRGRGGSMHLFSPEVGLMGTTGIVGPNILQATGAGYSFRLLKSDRVSVGFFGDGAVNNGAFHEGVNMAAIWDLPVIFVCENNMYATEVPFAYATRNIDVAERARTYGMPGIQVDGNDVVAIYEAAAAAVARARAGHRTDTDRSPHLPHPPPRGRHARRRLPNRRGDRRVENPRPDHLTAPGGRRSWSRDRIRVRRHRRGDQSDRGRRARVRHQQPVSRPIDRDRPCF